MQQEMTAHEHREMPAHMEDEITAHMHQLRALLLQVYHQYLLQSLSFSLIENTFYTGNTFYISSISSPKSLFLSLSLYIHTHTYIHTYIHNIRSLHTGITLAETRSEAKEFVRSEE